MGVPFWSSVNADDASAGYEGLDGGINDQNRFDAGILYPTNPWDVCILDGKILPGIARVKAKPERKVDKKNKAGTDGANPTVHGYNPGPVEIELTFWLPQQLFALVEQMKTLWPPLAKGKQKPIKIYHPALELVRISQVLIMGVTTPDEGPAVGSKKITIHALEFNPSIPKNVVNTPKAPAPDVVDQRKFTQGPPAAVNQSSADYNQSNAPQDLPSTSAGYTDPTQSTQDLP